MTGRALGHGFSGTGLLFSGLTFDYDAGALVGVVGPSGSGKSTLLSLLAGWERPLQGSIDRTGIERIGWVFQNPHGVPARSALDHVVLPLLAKAYPRRRAEGEALEILARFDLLGVAERPYRTLSGGEAQRLMLARAVAKSPQLLLVDEPTAQLDPVATRTVNAVLGEVADQRMIVVVATHDPDTARGCCAILDLADHAVC